MSKPNHSAWLKPIIEPLRSTFREVTLISLFINILALAVPVFVLQVYDRVVFHAGISTLQGLVLGMVLVLAFDFALRQTRARMMQGVALRLDINVGRKLFDKITALPLRQLEHKDSAYWQTLFRDAEVIRNTLSGGAAILVCDLPFVALFLALAFYIAEPIAWILVLILPLFVLLAALSGRTIARANLAERGAALSRDGLLANLITGRTTIKALALESNMKPAWEDLQGSTVQHAMNRGRQTDTYANLGTSLTMATLVAMTAVGALAIVEQNLTIGALIATNMLSARLFGPLNQLVGQWKNFMGFRQSVKRLDEVFSLADEREISAVSAAHPAGNINLENLTFSYAHRVGDGQHHAPVVRGISHAFRAGGIHALVGQNGCGKTTLLKLIMGLYPPDEGRALLDGADVAQFSRKDIANWIGYAPQEAVLFQGSVRDNIAYGLADPSDEQIILAANLVSLHQSIIDLPNGYDTDIGEAGRRLSGGLRQKITLARALIGNPPVILLDEPSSSLDRAAEEALAINLARLAKTRTIIVVTHSPVMLQVARTIVVLDKGRVSMAGTAVDVLPRLFAKPQQPPLGAPAPAAQNTVPQ